MYKVYIWTNRINHKQYVGATSASMEKRAGSRGCHYTGSPKFYNAIKKYGFDNFVCSVVEDGLTKEEAAKLEVKLINKLKTQNPEYGYNLREGGFPQLACKTPQDRRRKISNTLKQQRSSKEYRQRMSERMRAVWNDPDRRAILLYKRSKKPTSGRPRIKVFCEETGFLYNSLHEAGEAIGVSFSYLSVRFKRTNGPVVIGQRKCGTIYTLHKINVHSKESELLEASAGNAGGNQQPSLLSRDTR